MFNESKFRGKLGEKFLSLTAVAEKMGCDPSTLHRKITGKSDFSRSEIKQICEILDLSNEEVMAIFFAD